MEILELIGGLLEAGDACFCFLQIIAMMLDGTSFFAGYRAVREGRKRKAQMAEGVTPEERNIYKVVFWVLLPLAALTTGLVIYGFVKSRGRS
jgi:hypothetical protein